jgi:hypothetical protein
MPAKKSKTRTSRRGRPASRTSTKPKIKLPRKSRFGMNLRPGLIAALVLSSVQQPNVLQGPVNGDIQTKFNGVKDLVSQVNARFERNILAEQTPALAWASSSIAASFVPSSLTTTVAAGPSATAPAPSTAVVATGGQRDVVDFSRSSMAVSLPVIGRSLATTIQNATQIDFSEAIKPELVGMWTAADDLRMAVQCRNPHMKRMLFLKGGAGFFGNLLMAYVRSYVYMGAREGLKLKEIATTGMQTTIQRVTANAMVSANKIPLIIMTELLVNFHNKLHFAVHGVPLYENTVEGDAKKRAAVVILSDPDYADGHMTKIKRLLEEIPSNLPRIMSNPEQLLEFMEMYNQLTMMYENLTDRRRYAEFLEGVGQLLSNLGSESLPALTNLGSTFKRAFYEGGDFVDSVTNATEGVSEDFAQLVIDTFKIRKEQYQRCERKYEQYTVNSQAQAAAAAALSGTATSDDSFLDKVMTKMADLGFTAYHAELKTGCFQGALDFNQHLADSKGRLRGEMAGILKPINQQATNFVVQAKYIDEKLLGTGSPHGHLIGPERTKTVRSFAWEHGGEYVFTMIDYASASGVYYASYALTAGYWLIGSGSYRMLKYVFGRQSPSGGSAGAGGSSEFGQRIKQMSVEDMYQNFFVEPAAPPSSFFGTKRSAKKKSSTATTRRRRHKISAVCTKKPSKSSARRISKRR